MVSVLAGALRTPISSYELLKHPPLCTKTEAGGGCGEKTSAGWNHLCKVKLLIILGNRKLGQRSTALVRCSRDRRTALSGFEEEIAHPCELTTKPQASCAQFQIPSRKWPQASTPGPLLHRQIFR